MFVSDGNLEQLNL